MSFPPREYLRHMLVETDYLLQTSAGVTATQFAGDATLQRAFARSLEIIGEAAKKVPLSTRDQYAAIEWRAITGMRDRLIHDYFGVDYELVWDVIQQKIPQLQRELRQALGAP